MDEMMAMPPEYMEQRIAGSQQDMADYVAGSKRELKECMLLIYLEVARGAYKGRSEASQDEIQQAITCYESYFNSMKGATNLSKGDVVQAVKDEAERQHRFYSRLAELAKSFASHGASLEILEPGYLYSDPMWDTGICVGTGIRIEKKAYLYVAPRCAAKTYDYMALRQDPVAAQIIYIDDTLMLFAQHDQDVGEPFWQAYRGLIEKPRDIGKDFPQVWAAVIAGNTLLIDAEDDLGDDELDRLMGKYRVAAVIMANSSTFTARLYVGEYRLSRLEYEISEDY